MQGIQFPEATTQRTAGNNPNTNDLAVAIAKNDSISPDVSFVVSKFKMSPDELQQCIANDGEIFLCIMSGKPDKVKGIVPTMPPVFMSPFNVFEHFGYQVLNEEK